MEPKATCAGTNTIPHFVRPRCGRRVRGSQFDHKPRPPTATSLVAIHLRRLCRRASGIPPQAQHLASTDVLQTYITTPRIRACGYSGRYKKKTGAASRRSRSRGIQKIKLLLFLIPNIVCFVGTHGPCVHRQIKSYLTTLTALTEPSALISLRINRPFNGSTESLRPCRS